MGFMKRPKAPEPTAQEIAVEQRQSRMIDEEIAETEKRLKAVSRGKLGASSLLAGTGKEAPAPKSNNAKTNKPNMPRIGLGRMGR